MDRSSVERVRGISGRDKAAAIALAVVAILVGGALLAMGILLLLGFAAAGAAIGAGWLLVRRARRLFGRRADAPPIGVRRWHVGTLHVIEDEPVSRPDPALEIGVIESGERREPGSES